MFYSEQSSLVSQQTGGQYGGRFDIKKKTITFQ